MRLFALLLFVVLALPASAPAKDLTIMVHRGGSVTLGVPAYPENSMPAFRHTGRYFTQYMLEADVIPSSDGHLLIEHDEKLARNTRCTGFIKQTPFEKLRNECLIDRIGGGFAVQIPAPRSKWAQIPTLGELLNYVKVSGASLSLELKQADPATNTKVMDAIAASGIPIDHLVITCFIDSPLAEVQRRFPGIRTEYWAKDASQAMLDSARKYGIWAVGPQDGVTKEFIDQAHAQGTKVIPYVLNKLDTITAGVRNGIDGFVTDDSKRAQVALAPHPVFPEKVRVPGKGRHVAPLKVKCEAAQAETRGFCTGKWVLLVGEDGPGQRRFGRLKFRIPVGTSKTYRIALPQSVSNQVKVQKDIFTRIDLRTPVGHFVVVTFLKR